jgi:cytochrome c553
MKRYLTASLIAIASLGASAQDAKLGSVVAAEAKVNMCIGCHGIKGYQASFPEVHKVPMISGQNAKYIAAALAAYKKGERKHPTMKSIAVSLTDTDMTDIAVFYEKHGGTHEPLPEQPAPASVDVQALLTKGACSSCHGANFSKPIDGAYPKLAGQHADYLYVALKAYKTEGNPQVGRGNAIMGGQVKQFSLKELKAMAEYISALPGELKTVKEPYFR